MFTNVVWKQGQDDGTLAISGGIVSREERTAALGQLVLYI